MVWVFLDPGHTVKANQHAVQAGGDRGENRCRTHPDKAHGGSGRNSGGIVNGWQAGSGRVAWRSYGDLFVLLIQMAV